MGALEQLWAGWRSAYFADLITERAKADESIDYDRSLFERLLALPDDESNVVFRGDTCSVLLNAYPYTNGHMLIMPNRAVRELDDMTPEETSELWSLVRDGVNTLRTVYRCDGVNVGLNLGEAAGAGLPDHLHVHVLPRWKGDTNFIVATANTQVMPESLSASWQKLRDAWPG